MVANSGNSTDASNMVDGEDVNSWADQSGNGINAAQTTAADKPHWETGAADIGGLKFDDQFLDLSSDITIPANQDFTIMVRAKITDFTGGVALIGTAAFQDVVKWTGNKRGSVIIGGTGANTFEETGGLVLATDKYYIHTITRSNGSNGDLTYHIHGDTYDNKNWDDDAGRSDPDAFTLGNIGAAEDDNKNLAGFIKDVIVWKGTALSTQQRNDMYSYIEGQNEYVGVSNFSMSFDGNGDFISFTETTFNIEDTGDLLTVAFWAKRTDNNDMAAVFANSSSDGNKWIRFDEEGDALQIISDKSTAQKAQAPVTADTDWHHYVITSTGQSGGHAATVTMYEDGAAITVTNSSFGVSDNFDWTVDRIGSPATTGATREFKGLLYQMAIWDAVLDADAVAAVYNSGTPIDINKDAGNYDNSSDLIHYWDFSEGAGSTTADTVGSLNGTITNATFSTVTP